MNPIRAIARWTTRLVPGVTGPEIYPVAGWLIQPPLITAPHFGISAVLVSDNLCVPAARIKLSSNLLLQIPKIYDLWESLAAPEIVAYGNVEITPPNILELTDRLIESIAFLGDCVEAITLPKTFLYEKTNDFEVSILADLFVPLGGSENSPDLFISVAEPEVLECCFNQNGYTESLKQNQVYSEEQNNRKRIRDRNLFQPPSYCEILHPILMPPLYLEVNTGLDFYNPLRGYQKQGIQFLFDSPSALLADEMGTGKTVQAVNALRLLFRQAHIKSVLIVCPPAVIGSINLSIETGISEGWSGHFYHWAPELKLIVMRGEKKEKRKVNWQKKFHIYITTYDTLRSDIIDGTLIDFKMFDCIILDEAQKVKNRGTKTAQAILCLQARYRWALTGTPIENRLDDVISLFDFIRPGTFSGGMKYSSQDVSNVIKPFMLRRLKQDVLQDLPDKERQESWLDLDDVQKNSYNQELDLGRKKIETSLDKEQPFQTKRHIFALLAKLKQICNFASTQATSPKTDLLLELLETIVDNQKKVLIFSQYRIEGADKISQLLDKKGIRYVFYKGSPQQREQAVSDFRSKAEIAVFLATFDTAAQGITLTEATYVIHFDHLWNPAKMSQAEDRVHRIGQTKGVTIYSFWMKGTIDEGIKKKLIEKGILIDKTINSLAVTVDEDGLLSTEDWLDIFDIKLTRKTKENEQLDQIDQKKKARRIAVQSNFHNTQHQLYPSIASSHIIREIEQIKNVLKTITESQQQIFIVHGDYIGKSISIKEVTIMSDQQPIFNQQNATIGVNYAASGSRQELTQNVATTATEQNFDILLADFEHFINDLQQKHPNITAEVANQIIDIEAKEIQRSQPLRWQNFLNLKRLWHGGQKAAFKVGEHYAEHNPLGKGAIAFLEGVMEEPK